MKLKRLLNVIKAVNQMEKMFPSDDFILMNPKWNRGFNFKSGKQIQLIEVDVEEDVKIISEVAREVIKKKGDSDEI